MKRGRPKYEDILTPREWQVLNLLERGMTNEEIAGELDISFGGAKYHVSEIITKLGVSTRDDAVLVARARGRRTGVPAWIPFFGGRQQEAPSPWLALGGVAAAVLVALLFAVVLLGVFRGGSPGIDQDLTAIGLDTGQDELGTGETSIADLPGMRPFLGVTEVRGEMSIGAIEEGSPADVAGLRPGDQIQSVNGTEVDDARRLRDVIAGHAPGSSVEVGMLGGGSAAILLGESPCLPVPSFPGPDDLTDFVSLTRLGLFAADITPALRDWYDLQREGVLLFTAGIPGPAREAGIHDGDIVLEFGGVAVSAAGDMERILAEAPSDASLPISVLRCREQVDAVLGAPGIEVPGANLAPPAVREKLLAAIARGDLAEERLELEIRRHLTSPGLGFVRAVSPDAIVIEGLMSGDERTFEITSETRVFGADSVTDLRDGLVVNLLSQDGVTAGLIMSLAVPLER